MRLFYQAGRVVSFFVAQALCGERVFGVRRVPRTDPVLLTANHQSFLDPMLLTYALPRECHYMARDTLFHNEHFARIIRKLNAFPIKRATADLAGVKEALRRLSAGALVLAFPEGTRTTNGRVGPFQPGVFTIARRAGVSVVPAAIEGAFETWPRGSKLPRPARVCVEYGPPLRPDALAHLDAKQAAAEITRRVRTLHNALRRRIGRRPFEYAGQEAAPNDPASSATKIVAIRPIADRGLRIGG